MSLRAIFVTALAPYDRDDGNIGITGRDVALTPKAGLALAMAVHELASNAAKYGALSTPEGRLTVAWQVAASPSERALTSPGRKPRGRRCSHRHDAGLGRR